MKNYYKLIRTILNSDFSYYTLAKILILLVRLLLLSETSLLTCSATGKIILVHKKRYCITMCLNSRSQHSMKKQLTIFKRHGASRRFLPLRETWFNNTVVYISPLARKIEINKYQGLNFISEKYKENNNQKLKHDDLVEAHNVLCKYTTEHEKLKNLIEKYLKHLVIKYGDYHGDYTAENVLEYKDELYLIDYDRFRTDGIVILDPIHFLIQNYKILERVPWQCIVRNFITSKNISNPISQIALCQDDHEGFALLLLYSSTRIGHEEKTVSSKDYRNWHNDNSELISAFVGAQIV